jgi:putative zinc finger/helix-turn-helix YgiT family protein
MTRDTQAKPFPWLCFSCGKREVDSHVGPYTTAIKHDGALYDLEIPDFCAPACRICGELQITNNADAQIRAALREKVGLLTPEEIRRNRTELKLTQRELAEELGTAEATISRWETGAVVQSRAMDRFLRVYFAFPQARSALRAELGGLGREVNARLVSASPGTPSRSRPSR